MYRPFDLISAFHLTLAYFWLHLVVVGIVAALFSLLSYAKVYGSLDGNAASWVISKMTSLIAFGSLGLVMAYFLSRGLTPDNKDQNSLLTGISTTIIPAITGGIAYLEGSQATGDERPRSGMAVFLICTVLCCQAFVYQITYLYPA